MRGDIVGFARTCGFSEREVNDIAMASGEAFVNAVEHGHVPGSSVDVMYSSDERALTISIKDAGGGLDAAEKTWNSVVNKPFPGGYGRMMMRALMDEVFTHIDPGDGTTVVMRTFDAAEAVRWVDEGAGVAAFFLDPPDLREVLKLAREGKTLPQKSTYFHPKPPSGMVFHELNRDRRL